MGDELAPHWQRRAAGGIGVVDMSATRRRYERTAGWALQRMARANEVLARYVSSDGRGMSDDLLLARLPVVAAAVVESGTDGGSPPSAPSHADVSSAAAVGSAPAVSPATASSPPATAMLTRLQRRGDQPGVLSAQSLARTRSETGMAMRAALTERLSARGAVVPGASAPTLLLARRLDSAPQDHEGGGDDSAASPVAVSAPSIQEIQDAAPFVPLVRVASVDRASSSTTATLALSRALIPESGAASTAEAGESSLTARATLVASDPTSSPALLARQASSTAAAYPRYPSRTSDAPLAAGATTSLATHANYGTDSTAGQNAASQSMSMPGAMAASGVPSGAAPATTMLPMATIARHSDEPGASAAARSLAPPTTPLANASVLQRSAAAGRHADSPAASLTLHAPLTFVAERSSATHEAAVTRANPSVAVSPAALARKADGATATLPRVREVVPAVSHLGAERALSLSRAPNSASSNDTNAVHSGSASSEPMGAARGPMPAAPLALIWRSPRTAMPAGEIARSRSGEQQAVVMRAAVEAPGATSAVSTTETVSTAAAPTPNAIAPSLPDVHGLAEQVMRLITRRLEVERDRRGGKRWR